MKNDLNAEQLVETARLTSLPAIGTAWASFDQTRGAHSGIYAGLSLENERPVALVLLPEEIEANWKDATAWADEQDGDLPSRIDQRVLFKNLKSEFKTEAYWSCEPYAGAESYAWYQYFGYGRQDFNPKHDELRARAVRRVAI